MTANPTFSLLRFAVLAAAASATSAFAQTLPATAPTNALAPIAATTTPGSTPNNLQPHRATVTYAAGLLNVRADNSSLNQILRQISHLTGMTITGGVADERVFGNYGPAEPSTILATLLDGTGSNLLLRDGPNGIPAELVLTPRGGGPTPPSPDAPIFDSHDDRDEARSGDNPRDNPNDNPRQPPPPRGFPGQAQAPIAAQQPSLSQQQPSGPVSIPQPINNVNGSETNTSPTASTYPTTNSVSTDSLPTPSTTPSSTGIVDAPNPPPPGSTTVGAPPAPVTAEQIFQKLQALQAAQQQQNTQQPQSQPQPTTPAPK